MTFPQFRIVRLAKEHDKATRALFNSGSPPLDIYFKTRVTQDIRSNVTKCYIALQDNRIAGFYTLASMSLNLHDLPTGYQKNLPRYPMVPAILMGRLAVDKDFRGFGLGGDLIADALTRVIESPAGNFALVVDAKDDTAKGFYRHHDFIPLGGRPNTLFLPIADAVISQAEAE